MYHWYHRYSTLDRIMDGYNPRTSNQTLYSLDQEFVLLLMHWQNLRYKQVDWASVIGILDTAVDEVASRREVCGYKISDFLLFQY